MIGSDYLEHAFSLDEDSLWLFGFVFSTQHKALRSSMKNKSLENDVELTGYWLPATNRTDIFP
jgi:hypothetical protein